MKIYTRSGDDGTTGLYRHGRVPKSHPLIEAIGSVDELNSIIGIVIAGELSETAQAQLSRIQHHLFDVGAELASRNPERQSDERRDDNKATDSGPASVDATNEKVEQIKLQARHVELLEGWIDDWDKQLEPLKQFILPGGHPNAAQAHFARTICRRAERWVDLLTLQLKSAPSESFVAAYLNRLSDYLFVMARVINADHQCSDVYWEQGSDS